ncbi:hypothetical protein ACP275_09G111200 [Erythranthe tilingii]
MGKNRNYFGMIIIIAIMIILLVGVGGQNGQSPSVECIIKCTKQCLIIGGSRPLCVSECLKNCDDPKSKSKSKSFSNCVFASANSKCINFTSDPHKLEKCVRLCSEDCIHKQP